MQVEKVVNKLRAIIGSHHFAVIEADINEAIKLIEDLSAQVAPGTPAFAQGEVA